MQYSITNGNLIRVRVYNNNDVPVNIKIAYTDFHSLIYHDEFVYGVR